MKVLSFFSSLFFFFLFFVSCYSPLGGIGHSCRDDGQCRWGFFCEKSVPHGYCTMECDPHLPCPAHSACLELEAMDREGRIVMIHRCLALCSVAEDCREGYSCRLLGEQLKVCYPYPSCQVEEDCPKKYECRFLENDSTFKKFCIPR